MRSSLELMPRGMQHHPHWRERKVLLCYTQSISSHSGAGQLHQKNQGQQTTDIKRTPPLESVNMSNLSLLPEHSDWCWSLIWYHVGTRLLIQSTNVGTLISHRSGNSSTMNLDNIPLLLCFLYINYSVSPDHSLSTSDSICYFKTWKGTHIWKKAQIFWSWTSTLI